LRFWTKSFGQKEEDFSTIFFPWSVVTMRLSTLCFKKTGILFISFTIHSNDDQFTRNFYQM